LSDTKFESAAISAHGFQEQDVPWDKDDQTEGADESKVMLAVWFVDCGEVYNELQRE
jgi:hypothetical protein